MIFFPQVTLKNFLSYGDVTHTVQLTDQGKVLIVGENRDNGDPGISANGVGKTSIQNAILFGLFGKGIEPIKTDEFINIVNGKGLEVEVTFVVSGIQYRIVRKRKPNALELYKTEGDTEKTLTLDSMSNTQDQIVSILGMDYEMFVLLYFLSPSKQSFMAMKGSEQRDIIEKLLSLETLSERAESLKKISDELNTDLKIANRDLQNAEANKQEAERTLERLTQKSEDFDDSRNKRIAELGEVIDDLSGIDFSYLLERADELTEIQSKISQIEREISETDREIERYESEIEKINDQLDRHIKTEEKAKQYDKEKRAEIEEQEAILSEHGDIEQIQQMVQQYESYLADADRLHKIDSAIKDEQHVIDRAEELIESCKNELDALEDGVCFNCGAPHVDDDAVEKKQNELAKQEERKEKCEQEIESLKEKREEIGSYNDEDILTSEEYKDGRRLIREHDDAQSKLDDARKNLEENPYETDLSDEDVKQRRETIESHKSAIDDCNSTLKKKKESLESLKKEQSSIKEETDGLTRDELVKYQSDLDNAQAEFKKEKEAVNPYTSEIDEIKVPVIEDYESAVHELEEDIRHIKFLRKLLMDNNSFVRKNIIDMYIPYLNKKIVEYSLMLDLPHVTQINNDMSVSIDYMGKSVSFFNMSAGERLRLNVATTAAFKDLVATMGREPTVMFIDELFDGSLDESGMHKVFRFVSSMCNDVFIISHRDEFKKEVDKTLKVVKENGFSSIESV